MSTKADPKAVIERWVQAMDRHDLETAVACFDSDYRDEAPARRGEFLHGQEKVRENFTNLFKDIPDLRAEIREAVVSGDIVWIEWRMYGTRTNGTLFEIAGVNIFGVSSDRIVWGRIYTELVREAGGIDEQTKRMTKGNSE